MRKARADQNWSTKSTKALDRRRAVFHQAGRPKQQQEDQSGTDGSAGRQSFAEFPASGGLHQQDPSRGSLSPKSRHAQQPAQQDRRASGRQPLRSDDYGIESSSSDEGGRHWVCWRCSRVVASTAAGNAGLCNVCNSGRDTASSAIVRRRSGGPSLPALRGKTDPFGSAVLPLEGDTAVLMTYCQYSIAYVTNESNVPVIASVIPSSSLSIA